MPILRVAIILFVFVSPMTFGQVPRAMSFQGSLVDTVGSPRNGTFEMAFSLHTMGVGGIEVWSETQSSVDVEKGIFTVLLGSVTPLDSSDFAVPLFLEIEVDGELVGSRVQLVTVPYAFRVANLCQPGDYLNCYSGPAETLGIGECTGGIRNCAPGGSSFGSCEGELTPLTEVCDNGLDENCDGEPDDGCCSQIDNEPNDTEDVASSLATIGDCGETINRSGTLNDGSDVDWYRLPGSDGACAFEPTFSVVSSTDVQVCAYFQCVFGSGQDVTCNAGSSSTSVLGGLPGCCGSSVDATLDCLGTTDDSSDIFMAVSPTTSASCDNYTLTYGI